MTLELLVALGHTLAVSALSLVAVGLALMAAYLAVLSLAALFGAVRSPAAGGRTSRFAILVPAHNEEALIGRLLESLQQVDYPRALAHVYVVADNCTDRTAELARVCAGVRVLERFDALQRAKGFALRWLLERVPDEYDAYVVLDADSVVTPNFLSALDARLSGGAQAIQAYYTVLNASDSPVAAVRYAALAAVHYLRPLGRSVLGLSVGLKGNGMCFSAQVMRQFSWDWYSLAEDVEFHLALVHAGLRVEFAPEAVVLADMPVTLAQATTQNQRWERGRLALLQAHGFGLLLDALKRRSMVPIDAVVEQLIPPLSVPIMLGVLVLGVSVVLGAWLAATLALVSLVVQGVYLLLSLALVRAPASAYRALAFAPLYAVWKVALYARALGPQRSDAWVRTARS